MVTASGSPRRTRSRTDDAIATCSTTARSLKRSGRRAFSSAIIKASEYRRIAIGCPSSSRTTLPPLTSGSWTPSTARRQASASSASAALSSASSHPAAKPGFRFRSSYTRVRLVPAISTAALTMPVSARAFRNRSWRSLVSLSLLIELPHLDRFPGAYGSPDRVFCPTMELNKYHFIMTMGSLAKNLQRLAALFPSVQPAYEASEHLTTEGLYLRNMVEHAEMNLQAVSKGTPRGGFVRKSNLLPELPGNSGGLADATSTITNNEGHWLGGCLKVEKIIEEVQLIYDAAQA